MHHTCTSISNISQKCTRKVSSSVTVLFQMSWNMTLDLCINYKNYYVITFDYHTLVSVIFSISLMVVQVNLKTTKIS